MQSFNRSFIDQARIRTANKPRYFRRSRNNSLATIKNKPLSYENPQELNIFEKKRNQSSILQNGQISSEMIPQTDIQIYVPWSDSMFRYRKMQHVRINRGRIFDWFIEICCIFKQSWRTLWTAMSILDKMTIEKGKINPKNIHIYGMTSMFIASKFHEALNISLHDLVNNVGHNKYTKEEILKCEQEIFTWICIIRNDSSLHFPTIQDRVYECFPGISEIQAKKIMIEMFYCMQEPQMLIEEWQENFTEKDLTKRVGQCVLSGQRFKGCQMIEAYFKIEYGCNNIQQEGLNLKL